MSTITPRTFTDRVGRPIQLRSPTPQDAEAVLAYIHRIVEETEFFVIEPDELPATIEDEARWIEEQLQAAGRVFLIAETCGTIIGSCRLENGPFRRIAHRANLSIAVRREWQGVGIGRGMLEAILEWAERHSPIEKVCLDVFATNEAAIELYRKLGFVEEGRKGKDVKLSNGDYVDAIIMCRFVQ